MKKENVFTYMQKCVKIKREIGKDSTADLYRATCNQLKAFQNDSPLLWKEITKEYVNEFQIYLQKQGLKTNSINSYLSNFRAMYNSAIKEDVINFPHANPFSHLKLKREKTEKRALPRKIIEKMAKMRPGCTPQQKLVIDCYIFSYLTCGMPFIDLAYLTEKNIHGNTIVYHRAKTGTQVCIGITPGMRLLIQHYKKKGALRLFPLLPNKKVVSHETYKSYQHHFNEDLKEIGKQLKLPEKLTFYVVRHSWATEAQEQDIPTAVISQSLGHTSEKTTQIYLAGLSQDKLNKANIKVIGSVDRIVCGYS